MGARYATQVRELTDTVLTGSGSTDPSLRQAVAQRSREQSVGAPTTEVPAELLSYVDKVALHAYKVTDEDIAALKDHGHSEDEIFEVTVAAAVGSALERLDRGLAALRGSAE